MLMIMGYGTEEYRSVEVLLALSLVLNTMEVEVMLFVLYRNPFDLE